MQHLFLGHYYSTTHFVEDSIMTHEKNFEIKTKNFRWTKAVHLVVCRKYLVWSWRLPRALLIYISNPFWPWLHLQWKCHRMQICAQSARNSLDCKWCGLGSWKIFRRWKFLGKLLDILRNILSIDFTFECCWVNYFRNFIDLTLIQNFPVKSFLNSGNTWNYFVIPNSSSIIYGRAATTVKQQAA